ncbi:MAG: hypothetical protein IT365_24760 [Candidatus Hydrogenedentes bacterium]|nr:hypothetical protein [Candidatus Hydrogenedentota bacterium]
MNTRAKLPSTACVRGECGRYLCRLPIGVLLVFGALCSMTVPAPSVSAEDADADPNRQLIAQFNAEQQKSLRKLDKYEVVFEISVQFESADVAIQHTATLYQKHCLDQLIADVQRHTIERSRTGRVMEQDTSAKLLVGDTCAVYWLTRSPSAQMWEYAFAGDLPQPVALCKSIDMDGDYLHKYGYGALHFTLAQALDPKNANFYRYEVLLREDQKYSVRRFFKDRTGTWVDQPSQAFVVDPAQGYLIIENVMFEADGKPFRVITVKGGEVSPGVWFPMRVEHREFDESASMIPGEPGVTHISQYTVKSVNTTPTFNADTFTWRALGFPMDILIYRTDRIGEKQQLVIENGELVPQKP